LSDHFTSQDPCSSSEIV